MNEHLRTTVTVAIASVGRPERLHTSLQYIAAQEDAPDEFIVVSQEHDVATQDVARQAGARLIIVQQPGAAHAIQEAVSASSSDIVSFIDDDAEAHADWVRRIRAAFHADARLGLLGGRDNVHGDRAAGDVALTVGRVVRGRVVGNHHLGKGTARPAHHVKGANMSLRVAPARTVRVAELVSGKGAQTAFELILSLGILYQGYTGQYDPRVQVDHFPAPRAPGDERTLYTLERTAIMKHNECTAIALFQSRGQLLTYLLRSFLVGDRICCGVATSLFLAAKGDRAAQQRFRGSVKGILGGLRTARRFSRKA